MANDTFELTSQLIKGVGEKERQAKLNDMRLYQNHNVTYSISPLYARYVGDSITVAFNGNFKKLPVNGEQFTITRGHYTALLKYLRHIDRQIRVAKTNAKFMDTHTSGDFKRG